MFTSLLCKASPVKLMAKGEQQWLCTTGTVTPEPWCPGKRQETGDLPKQLGKGCRHEEMPEGISYPWLLSLKSHIWTLPKVPPAPQKPCAQCKHHLCAFNSTVLSQLQPVSTLALFNHYWHTSLVIWWSLDLHKPIATSLHGCHVTPVLCHLTRPWWLVNLPNWTMAIPGEGLSSQGMRTPFLNSSFQSPRQAKKTALLQGCR